MSTSYYIALDVGGTQLRAACYPQNSTDPVMVRKISTQEGPETPLQRLVNLIHSIWPQDGQVKAIAAALPGAVDPYNGIIFIAPNIRGWVNLHLKEILSAEFNVPIGIGNDANLAALGEWKYGAGQGHQNLIYITISTGIGGGVISDGKLLLGAHGLAGEIGHITVQPDGPLCGCGQRGHLEAIAAGPGIVRWIREEIQNGQPTRLTNISEPLTARHVSEAAAQGDPLAIAALERAGLYLGRGLADFLHIFNPSALILGGGVMRSGRLLLDPLHAALKKHVISSQYTDNLVIRQAALGDDAGLMGALALAQSTNA